ncbi:MAG: undecaprenyl/decaprenyl-phosphate alpha-N-acetylglucosaminyl 1-phosphate transferase [Treponema sp.]|jgi:UDP-GlcNAc:undecaprenyl-phosphate GlcNAc-1-phosphate transferase|nr:undecaprenyl/decaprenyl-phosphate alpha-N-acetylglucosaminyl 1-phosphate transferase [Treponema sp.]
MIIVAAAFALSFITVYLICRLSHRKAWYDKVDDRKIHTGDVPRLGGPGFAMAFILAALAVFRIRAELHFDARLIPAFFGMFITLVFGVIDDFRPLAPRSKLLSQIIAALLVVIPGYTFQDLLFFGDGFYTFGWLKAPLSVLWIVGLANAMNFIDGVDGLAGGLSALIALSYAVFFSSAAAADLSVCLAACIGGFLVFNLPIPKAKIFMGDGGSQFLGFTLAALPLLDGKSSLSGLPVFCAAALFLIPILDMLAAVWRRLRDGRRIDSPDKMHIHHKLINLGLNPWSLNCALWALQIVLLIFVFFTLRFISRPVVFLVLLVSAYLAAAVFFTAIHYSNKAKTAKPQNGSTP